MRVLYDLDLQRDLAPVLRYAPRAWGETEDGLIEPVSEDVWEYLEEVLDALSFGRQPRPAGWFDMG